MDDNNVANTKVIQNSQQTSESDIRQFRATFNNVVLTKLSSDLTAEEEIKSLFDCITRCISDIPWLLVCANVASDDTSSNFVTLKQNREDCVAFTKWLIIQIFQLVGRSSVKNVHLLAVNSLTSIYRLAETNNIEIFKIIIDDLIIFATAVCRADEEFASDDCCSVEIDCLPQGLNDFYDHTILKLNVVPLDVSDRGRIDCLLQLILSVITEVLSGIVLHNPRTILPLWIVLCNIVAGSTMFLKKLALTVMKSFVTIDDGPDDLLVLHEVTSVLLALVDHLYTSENNENVSEKSLTELEEFEKLLSCILPKLLLKNGVDRFDYEECASILSKSYTSVRTDSCRKAFSEILIDMLKDDVHMTVSWTVILPQKSRTSDDVEWLSVAKFYLIKKECEMYACNNWIMSPTWKSLLEQFKLYCKEPSNIEFLLEGLLMSCDILAVLVVSAKNGLHYSNCHGILELSHDIWIFSISTNWNWSMKDITLFYELVIRSSLLILKLQDSEPLFREYSLTLASLLSLPWLHSTLTTFDLKCAELLQNKSLLLAVKESLGDNYKREGLSILAMLPSEIAINWRIFIFKTELTSINRSLSSSAMRSLPWLLHMLGIQYFNRFEQPLKSFMESNMEFIDCHELVSVYLQLTCVICGDSTVEWCAEGSNQCKLESKLTCSGNSVNLIDDELVKYLESIWRFLFTHPEPNVRKDVAKNVSNLLKHFGGKDMLYELCLAYLEDSNYDVRHAFSCSTEFFINYLSSSSMINHQPYFLSRIQSVYLSAKGNGDVSMLETLIVSIASLAKASNSDLFQFAVIFLLENIQSSNILVRVTATLQLREVAAHKTLTPKQLFINCCSSISKFLCKLLSDAQERGDNNPLDIIKSTVYAFELSNINSALELMMRYLLPRLLENMSSYTNALVHMVANQLNLTTRTLIFNEFRHIFCHLICSCTQETRSKVLIYIVRETEAAIDDILFNHSQLIYNELMLHLASNKDEAIAALQKLPSRGRQSSALHSTEMFLGFLAFFDGHIFNSSIGTEDKQLAVQSLSEAIKLMGSKNLSTVHMKAMATLRSLLKITDHSIVPLCCRAWLSFIQTLDAAVVGSTLSQIVVALLPLVETCVDGVMQIFKYIIVEKRSVYQIYFCDLYCIPDVPELSPLLKIVKDSLGKSKSSRDLKVVLQPVINGIMHENNDVRTHTLSYLNNILQQQHQDLFESGLMEGDSVDPTVSQLIDKLMLGCRHSDSTLQMLIGQCLGKLGAIDPSRIQIESLSSAAGAKAQDIYFTIEDQTFVIELLTTLTKAFLGAPDNFVQNSASYAIQEILQLYKITAVTSSLNVSSSSGARIWNGLPDNVKDNLELLFHSRFVCEENLDYNHLCGRPIYNSSFGLTFPKWLSTWTEYLISKVEQSRARKLFWVCRKIVRHDIKVALFLLPQVLLQVIQENNPTFVEEVVQEISTVLKSSCETNLQLETDLHQMSVQVVFSVIDFLNNWILMTRIKLSQTAKRNTSNSGSDQLKEIDIVTPFLERIPKYLLAVASFNAQTYARALMNIEAHVKSDPSSLDTHLSFFLKLYKALDEPDGVAGITDISQGSTLHNQILSHENAGRHQDAVLCYQRAIVEDSNDLPLCEGYLRCLMDLDFPQTALVYSTGVLTQNPAWVRPMRSYQVEAAWKLANWEALDSYLDSKEPLKPTWGYQIGKILATVSHRDKAKYLKELEICRRDQMLPLSAASLENGSYERAYEHVLRFHMLEEIDQAVRTFLVAGKEEYRIEQVNRLICHWKNRQQLIRTSKKCLEPILNLRRVLLGMAADHLGSELSSNLKLEISRLWLQSAKIARRCGQLQPDYSSILSSFVTVLPEVGTEQAKWHWLKGEKEQAMRCLTKLINEIYPSFSMVTPNMKAKAKLLLARYSDESGNLESNAIIQMFREVLEINPEREDSHYFLARYYDRILTAAGRIDKRSDLVSLVIKHFGQSLKYGCRYVHLSLPRLLSLWLEFGSLLIELEKSNPRTTTSSNTLVTSQLRKNLTTIHTKLISEFTLFLPSYLYYTAFSQLVSRICHSHTEVFNHLKEIIAKIIVDYPQQSIWLMTAISKSSYLIRARRCQEIFHRACQLSPQLASFQADVNKLTDLLVQLCNMPVEATSQQLKVSTHCRGLKHLLADSGFSRVVLPFQVSLTALVPSNQQNNSLSNYHPFPNSQIFIQGIEDQIDVMPSLQKPKKITVRCSDGKLHSIMCKPKDDLRKDCRLMEFNTVVNKFLLKDPESRRRHLNIRTYSVVPLNEECGLIEWVPNLSGLRVILNEFYREKNIFVTGQTLKSLAANRNDSTDRKLEIFKTKLLPRFPAVLSEWFLRTFPNPISWYFARLSYARTSAVMSMVGYILGLGDRHGENILLDSSCGDTIHVDFNCLFNKGETFEWPEVVPFRLTHNMVDAMGPLGYEGVYRKSCETTMRVMRKQMDTLMSFLKPFIYDPLVEWSRPARGQSAFGPRSGNSGEQGEITNEMAKIHVQDIELRLTGVLKNKNSGKRTQVNPFPLSVEGQVATLIKQATDETNLSQMYIGWAAYM